MTTETMEFVHLTYVDPDEGINWNDVLYESVKRADIQLHTLTGHDAGAMLVLGKEPALVLMDKNNFLVYGREGVKRPFDFYKIDKHNGKNWLWLDILLNNKAMIADYELKTMVHERFMTDRRVKSGETIFVDEVCIKDFTVESVPVNGWADFFCPDACETKYLRGVRIIPLNKRECVIREEDGVWLFYNSCIMYIGYQHSYLDSIVLSEEKGEDEKDKLRIKSLFGEEDLIVPYVDNLA